jgi:PAS domain S-box-containing protein
MKLNHAPVINAMVDAAGIPAALVGAGGTVHYANEAFCALGDWNYPPGPDEHADVLDLHSAHFNKPLMWDDIRDGAQERPLQLSVRLRAAPGRTYRMRVSRLQDAADEDLYQLTLTDVSTMHELEGKMAQRDSILCRVISEFPQMICAADREGVIRLWNRRCEEITGFPAQSMVDNPEALSLLFPDPAYRKSILTRWNRREDQVIRHWEMDVRCRDGSVRVISWTVRYRELPVIEGLNHWAIGEDVTVLRQTLEELRQNEERLKIISRVTHDAVYDWDIAADHLWWSDGMAQLFGHPMDEVADNLNWWHDRVHPAYVNETVSSLEAAIESDVPGWSFDYLFRKRSGDYAYVHDRGYFIRDEDGKAVRMIGGMIDLTRQTLAEQELQLRDEELRKLIHFNTSRLQAPLARVVQKAKLLAAVQSADPEVSDLAAQLLAAAGELDIMFRRLAVIAEDDRESG